MNTNFLMKNCFLVISPQLPLILVTPLLPSLLPRYPHITLHLSIPLHLAILLLLLSLLLQYRLANNEHLSSHHTEPSQSPLQHNTPLNSTSTHSSPNLHHLPPGPILNLEPLTVIPPSPPGSVSSAAQSHNFSQSSTDSHHSSTTSAPPSPHAPPYRIHPNNTHNMATKGKHGIVQKRIQPTLLLTHLELTSYKQAMKDTDWLHAMNLEYDALMKNNTWTLVHLPPNR